MDSIIRRDRREKRSEKHMAKLQSEASRLFPSQGARRDRAQGSK